MATGRGPGGWGQGKEGKDREDWLLCNRCMHDTLTMAGQENKRTYTRTSELAHQPRDNVYTARWANVKKCENFRISSSLHFYSRRFFTRASRPRERRRAATHARSSAGYYFSRRIFPQMNFMKTVFALLINRSFVARPLSRPPPPAGLLRPRVLSALFAIPWTHVDHRAAHQLLIIILFQGPRKARRVHSSLLITFNGWNTIFGQPVHGHALLSDLPKLYRIKNEYNYAYLRCKRNIIPFGN